MKISEIRKMITPRGKQGNVKSKTSERSTYRVVFQLFGGTGRALGLRVGGHGYPSARKGGRRMSETGRCPSVVISVRIGCSSPIS